MQSIKNCQKKCIYTIKNSLKKRANLSQLSCIKIKKNVKNIVNSLRPDPTNGQRQSNYLLAIAGELFECV